MHVYFVRHGETSLNARRIHQSPNTPLSPRGQEDAISVAELLRTVNPDLLVSSEYTRALETARIIGQHVGLEPIRNELFYEIIRPSKLFGQSHFSIATFTYVFLSVLHRNNSAWRYADAENVAMITNRAERALSYLEAQRGVHKSIVVVSHTVFINIMVSYMCKHRMLDVRDLWRTFLHIERMKNTGVVHVEYLGPGNGNTCAWRIVDTV